MTAVYWICHPDHTDIFSQGYVGVSNRFSRRLYEHKKLTKNTILKLAIQKYGWENLIKQQVLIADSDYCLEMESKLRPKDSIGWNITIGGGKTPVVYGNKWNVGKPSWNKGLKLSKEHCENLSKSRIGVNPWNKGVKGAQVAWNKGVPMAYRDNAQFNQTHTCPHCSTVGKGNAMFRYHMDRCKHKGTE